MSAVRATALALAFALELGALAAVALAGWHLAGTLGRGVVVRALLALVAVVAWATLWGLLFSPHPAISSPAVVVTAGQWVMFAVAAAALVGAGRPGWAVVFAAVYVADRVVLALVP